MPAQLKRGEQFFGVLFLSLHYLKYNFNIPVCSYLYSQDVSCATCTMHLQNAGRRWNFSSSNLAGFGSRRVSFSASVQCSRDTA
jgi:hypothetical protein